MNICYPGNCICDAREWEGDTNCMGEIWCSLCERDHLPEGCDSPVREYTFGGPVPDYRYYFDKKLGVVLSVETHEMKRRVKYYFDPELTKPAGRKK